MPAGSALDEVLLLLGEDTEERVVGELLPVILRQPAHVLKLVKRPVSRAVLGVAHRHAPCLACQLGAKNKQVLARDGRRSRRCRGSRFGRARGPDRAPLRLGSAYRECDIQ